MNQADFLRETEELGKKISELAAKLGDVPQVNRKLLEMANTGFEQNFNLLKTVIINADIDRTIA